MSRSNIILLLIILTIPSYSQSGSQYREHQILGANQVITVFSNWGVIAQPEDQGPRGSWLHPNNGYLGDFSLLIGARVEYDSVAFATVTDCPVNRPALGRDYSNSGIRQAYEPRTLGASNLAMSNDSNTWPAGWTSWPFNTTAVLESYFEMDDNNDNEFNNSLENSLGIAFKPDTLNLDRNGLALKIEARYRQFNTGILDDALIMEYNIRNEGTTMYRQMVFGGLVGTYVGVTGNDHTPQEYDDDASFFDLENNATYFWDWDMDVSQNPAWVGDVGYAALAFIRSPGNPYDGIDNDRDNASQPGNSAPYFSAADFTGHNIQSGEQIVLIDRDFNRNIVSVPNDSFTVTTCGKNFTIYPGITYVEEGDSLTSNFFDGIDNDFDGLIDENYYVHYHFNAANMTAPFQINNTLGPTQYINYFTGQGLTDSNIDESGSDVDELGLTSFHYFAPSNQINLSDDENLFTLMSPANIDLSSLYSNGQILGGEDGDFVIGSGIFTLKPGEQQKVILALVYANTPSDLITKVQSIQTDPIFVVINKNFKVNKKFQLLVNYPNPFNPSTTVVFNLQKTCDVTLKIFNILGEKVTTLVSDRLSAGSYSIEWDASSQASGVYLYRLQASDYVETRKMVLMR